MLAVRCAQCAPQVMHLKEITVLIAAPFWLEGIAILGRLGDGVWYFSGATVDLQSPVFVKTTGLEQQEAAALLASRGSFPDCTLPRAP